MIDRITAGSPAQRPKASAIAAEFREIQKNLSKRKLRSRLIRKSESGLQKALRYVPHVFRSALHTLRGNGAAASRGRRVQTPARTSANCD